jgi:hypothetical protein
MKVIKGQTTKNTRVLEVNLPDQDEPIAMRFRRPDERYLVPSFFFATRDGLANSLEEIREECCRTFESKYPPKVTMVVQNLRKGRRAYGIVSGHFSPLDLEYRTEPDQPEQWRCVLR